VDAILADGLLSEAEESAVANFQRLSALTQNELDADGAFAKVGKAAVLRRVMSGKPPENLQINFGLPFILQKKEVLLWVFQNVQYFSTKTTRTYVAGNSGMSVRVMKGVYYRVGQTKGHSVAKDDLVSEGMGTLAVTNKHLLFDGPGKDVKFGIDKLVTVQPLSDGIMVQRDTQTAKPQGFKTGDGWFLYNLVMNATQVEV
jgi:hypothetical protein